MFAEIVCKDINQLRFVLHDELQKIKGIERTETFISLDESFNRNVPVYKERLSLKLNQSKIFNVQTFTFNASLNPFPSKLKAKNKQHDGDTRSQCQHGIMGDDEIIILFDHQSPAGLWWLNTNS